MNDPKLDCNMFFFLMVLEMIKISFLANTDTFKLPNLKLIFFYEVTVSTEHVLSYETS